MEIEKLYLIHGIVMGITIFILLPLGLFMSLGRKYVGDNWYVYHKNIMLSVAVMMFIGVMISLYTKEKEKKDMKHKLGLRHGTLGIIIFILILIQIWWGIVMRKEVSTKTEERLIKKESWLIIHKIFAFTIVCLVSYQIYLGINIYKDKIKINK
jgi:cytochrome b561